MKIVTHDERFHADDVFATAVMQLLFGDKAEIKRSRNPQDIEAADIVYDVGSIYDAEKNRFDHHQQEFTEARENGIPYAAFGLVWKKWGVELCGSQEAADVVDKKLVQNIDADDNGFVTHDKRHEDYSSYHMDDLLKIFRPTWKEEEEYDSRFFEAVDFVKPILEREIEMAKLKVEAMVIVEKAYEDAEDKRLVELEKSLPWSSVLKKYDDTAFVIAPGFKDDRWVMIAVQDDGYVNRIDPPMEWRGLYDEELQKVSGVEDAVFCHRGGFLTIAKSREGIIKMADIVLKR